MEYMHVNVHGGGNKPDALEEFATALVAIADRDGDEIKALGVKPARLPARRRLRSAVLREDRGAVRHEQVLRR